MFSFSGNNSTFLSQTSTNSSWKRCVLLLNPNYGCHSPLLHSRNTRHDCRNRSFFKRLHSPLSFSALTYLMILFYHLAGKMYLYSQCKKQDLSTKYPHVSLLNLTFKACRSHFVFCKVENNTTIEWSIFSRPI